MSALEVLSVVAWNLGVPVLAVLWLALAPGRSRLAATIDAAVAILVCIGMLLTALWLAVPQWMILVPLAAIPLAMLLRRRRDSRTSSDVPSHARPRATRIVVALLRGGALAAATVVVFAALSGRAPAGEEVVRLASPLPEGVWLVANGGGTGLVNAHLRTLDDPSTPEWRGQSRAVDLVGAGAWGSRTRPTLAPALSDFEIFDRPVLAPCAGRVVITHDGEPERPNGSAAWRSRPGNHVVLECGPVWVLLAHFTPGSIAVDPGDRVGVGDAIARVGNTGASGEPHLHIHAQRPGTLEAPFAGRPLAIRIDGRSLARNDRLHTEGASSGAPRPEEKSP